ncbi:MAG: FixH family protein [Caryophanon sp.]|nr:FixH family protein [Caryophanon sp.]
MKRAWSGLLLTTWLLAACGESAAVSSSHTEQMEMIDVTFLTPTELPVGEATLSVALTQADDIVEDADSVVFEVWESGNSAQAEHINATYVEDGIYEATYTFKEDGVYYMFAHTTARGLHVMPKQQMIVGEVSEQMITNDDYTGSMTEKK